MISLSNLESRVIRIEKEVFKEEYKKINVYVPIPKGYVSLKEFAREFQFISGTGLSDIIKNYMPFFKEDILQNGNKICVNPMSVIRLLESGEYRSSRVLNSYNKWKSVHPKLNKLYLKYMKEKEESNHGETS